jgi:predicted DNA-binding transcriptional regulator AlpA
MDSSQAAPITDEYIEPGPLASELGVSGRTLHRWYTERNGPPRVQIGRKILYRRQAVREWLRSREEAQPRAKQRSA